MARCYLSGKVVCRQALLLIGAGLILVAANAAEQTDLSGDASDFNRRAAALFHDKYFFHPWDESEHTTDGEDWSLPPWVRAAPGSGIQVPDKVLGADFPGRPQRQVRLTWRELEPSPGRYEFEAARKKILSASQGGRFVIKTGLEAAVWETRYFRGLANAAVARVTPGSAPRWLETLGVPRTEEKPNASNPFQVVNLDIYHPEYHARYLKLLEAFGRSGILQMPEVGICYLHLRSPSRGEEGIGPPPGDPLRPRFEERLRAWAAAAGPAVRKLALVSHAEPDLALALKLGMGQRNGFVEHYLMHAPNPGLGQFVDEEGYLVADEGHPMISGGRASGDENEEYRNEVRFGPLATFPHRYHESMLRALQMRRSFLWAEGGRWLVNPPLLHYVAFELGQTVKSAPDAWCYLRESYVPGARVGKPGLKAAPVKNFERWLFQRDADGARTIPAERVEIPKQMFEFARDRLYEFTARRTDAASGQRQIRLALADEFLAGGPHPVAVKITYLDRGGAVWRLGCDTASGKAERTVTCGDTGRERTATFIVRDARFAHTGYRGADFWIEALKGDAVIRMARVIKLDKME